MDNAHTATAIYSKELGGVILVDAIPRIAEITVDGTVYLPDELPVSFSWTEGSTHIISSRAIIKESPDTRYVFDSWKDKNIEKDRTVTIGPETQEFIALFKTQHFLKPLTEYGLITGGGWHDEGNTASFALESDIVIDKKDESIRYVFESWDFGDYQNLPSNTIDIEESATVKANWDKQFFMQLKTNIPDYDLFGTGWYTEDKKLVLIAEEDLESPNSDIKYVFERWVSKGVNPVIIPSAHSPATTIVVSEPYLIEAHYKKSYLVNVWTPFGDALGGGFYAEGEIAEISLLNTDVVVEPKKVRKVFGSWDTGGARTMDFAEDAIIDPTVAQNLLIFVENPTTISANWNTQYYLDVQTAEGKTKGSGWYDLGRLVPISVDTRSIPPGMWSVSVFDRWSGDVDSASMNERVLMNKAKTVIAGYKQDSTPGIINSIILAAVVGVGGIVYLKTHSKINFKIPRKGTREKYPNPFESYKENPFETDYQIPRVAPKKNTVVDWLMGK